MESRSSARLAFLLWCLSSCCWAEYVYTCEDVRRIYRESGCCMATTRGERLSTFIDLPSNLNCLSCQGVYTEFEKYCLGNIGGSELRLAVPSNVCSIPGCVLRGGVLNTTSGACPLFIPEEHCHGCYTAVYFWAGYNNNTGETRFCTKVSNLGLSGADCPAVENLWLNDVIEPGYSIREITQNSSWYSRGGWGITSGGSRSLCIQLSCKVGLIRGVYTLDLAGNATAYGHTKIPFCMPEHPMPPPVVSTTTAAAIATPTASTSRTPTRTPGTTAVPTHSATDVVTTATTTTMSPTVPTPSNSPPPQPRPPCLNPNETHTHTGSAIYDSWQSNDECVLVTLQSIGWNRTRGITILVYQVSVGASEDCTFDVLGWMVENECTISTASAFVTSLASEEEGSRRRIPHGLFFDSGQGLYTLLVEGIVGVGYRSVYLHTTYPTYYKGSILAPTCQVEQACLMYLDPRSGGGYPVWPDLPAFFDPTDRYMRMPVFTEMVSRTCQAAALGQHGSFPELVSLIRQNPAYPSGDASWRMGPSISAGRGCSLSLDRVSHGSTLNLTIQTRDAPFANSSFIRMCDERRDLCRVLNRTDGGSHMRITSTLFIIVRNGAAISIQNISVVTRAIREDHENGGGRILLPPVALSSADLGLPLPQLLVSAPSDYFVETFASTYFFWPQKASSFTMRFAFGVPRHQMASSYESAPGIKMEFVEATCRT